MADEEHAHEIIIIKRHGSHEDGHHGGAWKIAFADFMTAMMAFFLVMWLISANDKTKATIASYFNPVKLVDTTTQPKGLEDAKAVESAAPSKTGAKSATSKEAPSKDNPKAEAQDAAKAGGEEAAASKAKEKRLGAAVLDDPFAALTEIAGTKGAGDHAAAPPAPSSSTKTVVVAISRKGGDAFRDPFAPPPPLEADAPPVTPEPEEAEPKRLPRGGNPASTDVPSGKGNAVADRADDANRIALEGSAAFAEPQQRPDPARPAKAQPVAAARGGTAPPVDTTAESGELKAQIAAAAKGNGQDKAGPQIDVRRTDGGLLVSLTDSADFEMFPSGSATPARKVVLMMDRIAQVLKARAGSIVVRGFTDSRPYKAGRYDNWHLSLDRAQVTHYMLVRGGVDESRMAHIEGYADRSLKTGIDPTSPMNRRIEILIKDPAR